jgi:hypothetical protein
MAQKAANDDARQPPADLAEAFRRSIDGQRKPPAPSRTRKPALKKKTAAKVAAKARTSQKDVLETP